MSMCGDAEAVVTCVDQPSVYLQLVAVKRIVYFA